MHYRTVRSVLRVEPLGPVRTLARLMANLRRLLAQAARMLFIANVSVRAPAGRLPT
jgi:hypothetical protein